MFITDDLRDEYTHKTFARARVSHHPSRHDRSSIIPRASSPPPSLTRARAEDSPPPPARESTSPVFVVFAPPKTWPRFDSHTVQPECARFPCARASSSSSSTSTDTFVSDTKIARHLVRDRRLTARASSASSSSSSSSSRARTAWLFFLPSRSFRSRVLLAVASLVARRFSARACVASSSRARSSRSRSMPFHCYPRERRASRVARQRRDESRARTDREANDAIEGVG